MGGGVTMNNMLSRDILQIEIIPIFDLANDLI